MLANCLPASSRQRSLALPALYASLTLCAAFSTIRLPSHSAGAAPLVPLPMMLSFCSSCQHFILCHPVALLYMPPCHPHFCATLLEPAM